MENLESPNLLSDEQVDTVGPPVIDVVFLVGEPRLSFFSETISNWDSLTIS